MPKSYTHSNNRVFVRVFPQSKSPLLTQNYEFGEFSTVSTPPTTKSIFIYINKNALAKGIVMKIYSYKSELYRALNNAIQAVPSRSTSKILEGVLIETKEDEMIITGTDTFMVVESKLSAKCDGIADFVAPAALFANIIGKHPSEEEMMEYGYVKRKNTGGGKKVRITSRPYHYISSDGYDIYVGKNNFQNDELSFKFASGNDWWFHAKGQPGSHVIVKSKNEELPDRTFEEAGRLAAYYSKNRGADKVEIDYIQKKHVKKPNGAKPGFVVYYTNYSLVIDSDISNIKNVQD